MVTDMTDTNADSEIW